MERAIALNIYQSRQAKYRGLEIVPGKLDSAIHRISVIVMQPRSQGVCALSGRKKLWERGWMMIMRVMAMTVADDNDNDNDNGNDNGNDRDTG